MMAAWSRQKEAGLLTTRAIKAWSAVHKWTSLVCTAFLLLMCVTGLPLIFHHEIDHALGNAVEPPAMAAGTPKAALDSVVASGRRRHPDEVVQFAVWDKDEPDLVYLVMAPTYTTQDGRILTVDARTAEVLGEPNTRTSLTAVLLRLHVDMFTGLPGKLFLGLMGLLFVVAIVSGIVLYAPFMRRLPFATVRTDRSPRVKWLDLHNLLGIVTVAWAVVVGLTGVINTWADLVLKVWQADQLAAMVAPYQGKPPAAARAPLQGVIATAERAAPNMTPAFVAFPGTPFTSAHHYAVFMRGDTPLTSRLLKPALIDGETGQLTDMRELPWYVTTLLVSQPLHFGDYGGMPLKLIWAALDVITIVVLGSGLYLWIGRRRMATADRMAELEPVSAAGPQPQRQPAE
jgi:uncharacterized iron-regulated membrane protein